MADQRGILGTLGSIGSAIGRGIGSIFGVGKSAEAEAPKPVTQEQAFLAGVGTPMTSSNVASGAYHDYDNSLDVGFKNGNFYQYHDISPDEAKSFFNAGSKGKWVWDNLRLRGTKFGYQKSYSYLGGLGTAPKYAQNPQHFAEHRTIGPEGMTPYSWRQGHGPYHPSYGIPQNTGPHPWGPSPEEIETAPGYGKNRPSAAEQLAQAFGKGKKHYAAGGQVSGMAGVEDDEDNIPARLTQDEFVMPRDAATNPENRMMLEMMRSGMSPMAIFRAMKGKHFRTGGLVGDTYGIAEPHRPLETIPLAGDEPAIASGYGFAPPNNPFPSMAGSTPSAEPWSLESTQLQVLAAINSIQGGGGTAAPEPPWAKEVKPGNITNWLQGFFGSDGLGFGKNFTAGIGNIGSWLGNAPTKGPTEMGIAGAEVGAAAGPIGLAVAGATLMFSKLKDAGMQVVDTFTNIFMNPKAGIGALTAPYQSQVANFSPGTVERFELALDNASAAVGRIFEPIIENARMFADELNVLTTGVGPELRSAIVELMPPLRQFGREGITALVSIIRDGVAEIRPAFAYLGVAGQSFGEMLRTGVELGRGLWNSLRAVGEASFQLFNALNPFGTSIESVGQAFRFVIEPIQMFAATLVAASAVIRQSLSSQGVASTLLATQSPWGLYSLATGGAGGQSFAQIFQQAMAQMQTPAGSPQGGMTYAAQQARYVGIEDVGREARQRAFSTGGEDPAQQTANNTAATVALLQTLSQNMNVGNAALIAVLTQALQQGQQVM